MRSWFLIAIMMALPRPAAADDMAAARGLFAEANHLVDRGALDEALAIYREAYARHPAPEILANIGYVLEEQGRTGDAANVWAELLRVADPDFAQRDEVEQRLALSTATLGQLQFRGATGRVTIDGVSVDPARTRWVAPGKHVVVIGALEREIEVGEREVRGVTFVPPEPRPAFLHRPYVWAGAAALGLASIGLVSSRVADRAHDDFERSIARSESQRYDEARAAEDRSRAATAVARVSFGAAAVAVAVATYLVHRERRDRRPSRIVIDVIDGGGAVAVGGGF